MKKAQVTMFIILGIVIVAVIAIGLYLREDISNALAEAKIKRSTVLQQQAAEARGLISNCLGYVAGDAVLKIASQGGYYEPPSPVYYDMYSIPVYYDKGKEKVPGLDDIEEGIAAYINANMARCTGDFPGLRFTAEALDEPDSSVAIGNEISLELDWPVRIGNEEKATVSDFSARLAISLKSPYEKAISLYDEQKGISLISLSDLAKLAKDREYILHFDFEEEAVLYILTFNDILIKKQPLVYTFAVRPEKTDKYVHEGIDLTDLFSLPEGTEEGSLEEELGE